MDELWKIAVSVAGLGAVVSFVIWSLYRQWLRLPIFQVLTKEQLYKLFCLFLILTFLFAIAGLAAYVFASNTVTTGDISVGGDISANGNVNLLSGDFREKVFITNGISEEEQEAAVARYRKQLMENISHRANLEGQIEARRQLFDRFATDISSQHSFDEVGLQKTQEEIQRSLSDGQKHTPYRVGGDDIRTVVDSAKYIADLLYTHANYRDALPAYRLSTLLDPLNSDAWNSLGQCYRERGEMLSAIRSFHNAIELAKEDAPSSVRYLANLATVYQQLDLLERAEGILIGVQKYYGRTKNESALATVNANLGVISSQIGEFDKAAEYYKEALKSFGSTGQTGQTRATYFNICQSYLGSDNIPKATHYREKYARSLKEAETDLSSEANLLVLDSQFMEKEGNDRGGAKTLEEAATIMSNIGDDFHSALVFRNAGDMYARSGNVKKAKLCFDRGLNAAERINNIELIVTITELEAALDAQ